MATIFVHAAIPVVARRAWVWPEGIVRRLTWVAAVCACLPDVDMIAFLFSVRPPSVWAHGGLAHSLLFAAVVAVVAALLGFRSLGVRSREFARVTGFLFFATAAHPLLDATTSNDVAVALLAPFTNARFAFPFKLVPSAPLGLTEFFGFWGALTLTNELLYVIIPLMIVVTWVVGRRGDPDAKAATTRFTVRRALLWGVAVVGARVALPDYFVPVLPRTLRAVGTLDAGNPRDIARDGLPGGKLLDTWDELHAAGLFDRDLHPTNPVWSSSFFPSWYGGEAGRWSDGPPTLIWRTLVGFAPPTEREARDWATRAKAGDGAATQRILTLAPTEKIDLAYGHYDFPATTRALKRTHNGSPRYWNGRCNGVAAASLTVPEPFRAVDVVGVDGERVRFRPNDIKSLLAVAYFFTEVRTDIGHSCSVIGFDAGASCSMNPAVLVLGLLNRIGLAHQSFLIDALPTPAAQFYAVAGARVSVRRGPYPVGTTPHEAALDGRVTSLLDVAIDLTLSATTLSDALANVRDPSDPSGTRYLKVGLHPVSMSYTATLALDAKSTLIGGVWTGDPPDGPDGILAPGGGPALVDGKILDEDLIPWPLVRELARASVDDGPGVPTLDLRTACDGRCK